MLAWRFQVTFGLGVVLMACSSDPPDPRAGKSALAAGATERRTYSVFWNAITQEPAGGIQVTIDVPTGWTEAITPMGAPRFKVPGVSLPGPMVSATSCGGKDFATCIAPMIEDGATRSELDGGRVWTVQRGDRGGITARIFIPAPASGSVVMCMVVLPAELADRLDELRPFVESIQVKGG